MTEAPRSFSVTEDCRSRVSFCATGFSPRCENILLSRLVNVGFRTGPPAGGDAKGVVDVGGAGCPAPGEGSAIFRSSVGEASGRLSCALGNGDNLEDSAGVAPAPAIMTAFRRQGVVQMRWLVYRGLSVYE